MLTPQLRSFHLALHIEGTLRKHGNTLHGVLNIGGRTLPGAELKQFLRNHKANNPRHVVFCPCGHVDDSGHCLGHAVEASEVTP